MDRADESRCAKRRRTSSDTVLRPCLDSSDDEDAPTPTEQWLGEQAFRIYTEWRVGKGRPIWHAAAVTIQRCFRRFRAELEDERRGMGMTWDEEYGTTWVDDEELGIAYQYEAWIAAGEPDDERRWFVSRREVVDFQVLSGDT